MEGKKKKKQSNPNIKELSLLIRVFEIMNENANSNEVPFLTKCA